MMNFEKPETQNITRLWCATVYVFTPDRSKILLLNHRKLKRWVAPGGKIDPNELPDIAALRETFEETGIRVRLLGGQTPVQDGLVKPFGTQLNVVIPGEREHIDLIYVAEPLGSMEPVLNEQESSGVKWFAIEDVLKPEFNTFEVVREMIGHMCKTQSCLQEQEGLQNELQTP